MEDTGSWAIYAMTQMDAIICSFIDKKRIVYLSLGCMDKIDQEKYIYISVGII
jgi:hypothetical protein